MGLMEDDTKSIVEKNVYAIIRQIQEKSKIKFGSDVKPEARLIKDIGFDSLNVVEFFFALEYDYKIEIDEDEVVKAKTIQDVINFLIAKLKEDVCYGFVRKDAEYYRRAIEC
ncbi:MAG: phosphopantetheine-binding protein [Candidatus Falkowbacteria bacterium]